MSRSAQQSAEDASRGARLPAGATLGLALLDPASGDVTALVGQKLGDGMKEGWNNATRARRQVGSSVKPLLYTLALSKGWSEADTVPDLPLEGDYQPKNYSGRFSGQPVTLRYALDHSLNLPTVRLAQGLGLNAFISKLRELGLSPAPDTGLPLAIGALEASPLELAAAYAPFANGGVYHAPRLITRLVASGKTLLTVPPSEGRRVWDEQTAWLGLDLLRGVVNDLTPREGGLGWKARILGREVGGKTGTTNDVRDLWFAGVTPGLSGAVWVGRSDNAPLPGSAYSGDVAAPIWQAAASGALRGQPLAGFTPPDGVEVRQLDGVPMAFRSGDGSFRRAADRATDPAADQGSQADASGADSGATLPAAPVQPDAAPAKAVQPDVPQPDTTQPSVAQPDPAAAGTDAPATAQPDPSG
ncbi:MAG: penicillin-binding transpeptidase domain-containing protein, partial [Deinococcus sp.]